MGIARKARLARAVWETEGIRGVIGRLYANVKAVTAPVRVDECAIVAAVLLREFDDGLMIDVGAHHGASLDPFARAGWQVIAFEPDSMNRDKLARVYRRYSNVSIDARAVADFERGKVPLFRSRKSTGISGLHPFDSSHEQAELICTTTLERVLAQCDGQLVRFLKIDTEGFDLPVLKGLPTEICPDAIVCEFEDAKSAALDYTHVDLAEELERRGYIVLMSEWYPVHKYGAAHRWRRVVRWPATLLDPRGWGNFVAIRNASVAHQVIESFERETKKHGPRGDNA